MTRSPNVDGPWSIHHLLFTKNSLRRFVRRLEQLSGLEGNKQRNSPGWQQAAWGPWEWDGENRLGYRPFGSQCCSWGWGRQRARSGSHLKLPRRPNRPHQIRLASEPRRAAELDKSRAGSKPGSRDCFLTQREATSQAAPRLCDQRRARFHHSEFAGLGRRVGPDFAGPVGVHAATSRDPPS